MDQDKKKKIIVASSITAGAIILIAGGIYAYIATRPVKVPDPQKDPKAAREFISSKHFQNLTHQQQSDFVRNMRPRTRPTREQMDQARKEMRSMSDEQRRTMMQNMRKVRNREMEARLDKFFKMSKAEQLAELDRRIAEGDKRRAEMAKRRAEREKQRQAVNQQGQQKSENNNNNSNNNNRRRRRPSAQMRREFEASIPPATRAKMQEYFQMERLRREGKLK